MLQHLATSDNPIRNIWDLGYRRICSILPPDAEVSEHSMLHKRIAAGENPRGKAPGRRNRDGKWVGYDFTQHDPEPQDLDAWLDWGAGCGIKTGDGLIAVDIDTRDKDAAKLIYQIAQDVLGPANVRFGDRPKALLLYAIADDVPFRKLRFATATEEKAHVEILGAGRQFVAYGPHPRTGKPYLWPEGIPARADLTPITPDDLDAFFEAVASSFEGAETIRAADTDRTGVDQDALRGDPKLIRDAMRNMPNRDETFPTRDHYLAMGYGLKAGLGPDLEEEALDLFLQWCGRWDRDGEKNEPDKAIADWQRMKPPYGIGAEHIFRLAEDLTGWTGRAEAFFEPQELEGEEQHRDTSLFQLRTIDDVFNMPEPKFLIDRHIPETGFGILFGDPGCGKSFLALDMALTLAYGLGDWHGDATHGAGRGGVLYIAGEGASGFRSRIRAWQHERLDAQTAKRTPNFHMLFEPVNFMRAEDIGKLAKSVQNAGLKDLSLIVVDTVSRSIPGADENLQKDMTIFVHACDALRHSTGAFVLGVHHTSKAGEMRGSSVLLGQADVVLRLTRKKGATVGRLGVDKQKDAPDGWSEPYRFDLVHTVDGLSSLVPSRVEDGGTVEGGAIGLPQQQEMLKAMQAAWDAKEPWASAVQSQRYAPRIMAQEFEIRAEDATALIGLWEQQGLVKVEIWDGRNKRRGYKVVGKLVEIDASAEADGSDDADGSSGFEGVFE